jgi:hypothetical protein
MKKIRLDRIILLIAYIVPCCFFSVVSLASDHSAQYFSLKNNGTITGVASKREITRIVFDADIENVQGIAGELEYVVQGRDLFLRTSADKPVNFFVKLEHNLNYRFTLVVEDMPSTQIFVQSNDNFKPEIAKTQYLGEVSAELKERISKIIELTLKPKKHIGYEIIKTDKFIKSDIKGLSLKQVGIISGEMLVAQKITITNKSKIIQKFKLADFKHKDNLGVYLSKNELLPKEKCVLIRISQK